MGVSAKATLGELTEDGRLELNLGIAVSGVEGPGGITMRKWSKRAEHHPLSSASLTTRMCVALSFKSFP